MNYTIEPKIKYKDIDVSLNDKEAEIYYNKYFNTKLKLIKSGEVSTGECFNYATNNYDLQVLADCLGYIMKYYNEVNIKDLRAGDIVAIYDSFVDKAGDIIDKLTEDTIQHFGKVIRTNNTISGTIIRSKWGSQGIFESDLYSLPDYGNKAIFYRKKIKE